MAGAYVAGLELLELLLGAEFVCLLEREVLVGVCKVGWEKEEELV